MSVFIYFAIKTLSGGGWKKTRGIHKLSFQEFFLSNILDKCKYRQTVKCKWSTKNNICFLNHAIYVNGIGPSICTFPRSEKFIFKITGQHLGFFRVGFSENWSSLQQCVLYSNVFFLQFARF